MKLKPTHWLLVLFCVSIGAIVFALARLDEREQPEDPQARPTGPSQLIRGMRTKAARLKAVADQRRAQQLMQDLADLGFGENG